MERFCPFANRPVGVLAKQKVYLLESTTIRFDSGETSHFYNGRGYPGQLIYCRNIFAC